MKKPVRVLRIQHNFVEPTNQKLLDELSNFPELEVHAICPRWGIESGNMRVLRETTRDNLNIAKTVLTKHYVTTFYIQKLGEIIRRLKPDIVSCHEEPCSLTAGQVLASAKMYSPKSKIVFCSAQNIYKNYPPPFGQIEKWMYRSAVAGYGCCEGVREVARRKGYEKRFEIFPLGIDPDLFSYRPRDADKSGQPFIVGYAGQLVEEKGLFTLLRAFSGLKGDVRLHLLGCGPAVDGILDEAKKAGVANHLLFIEPVPHSEVHVVMDTFDVLVVPSETTPTWKEQFGRVITEAFSVGVPVIGSDSGSVPEVVGDAGMIFEEKNHEQLAAHLQRFIDNPELLPALSEKGRRRVEEHYTFETLAKLNRDLFISVMEEG